MCDHDWMIYAPISYPNLYFCTKCHRLEELNLEKGCTRCTHRAKAFKESPCDVCYTESVQYGQLFTEFIYDRVFSAMDLGY